MKLAPERSRVTVHTFAEGLFSALAHDLELSVEAAGLGGEASESEASAVAEVRVQVASLRVAGVMKRGKLETSVLSRGDQDTIERQIRQDVLPGDAIALRGERDATTGRTVVTVRSARGVETITCDVTVSPEDGAVRAKGRTEVSLQSLGAPPVKGPMGAFRVKDRVRVEFDLVFVRSP